MAAQCWGDRRRALMGGTGWGGEGDVGDGRAEGRVKLESLGRDRADQEELELELL